MTFYSLFTLKVVVFYHGFRESQSLQHQKGDCCVVCIVSCISFSRTCIFFWKSNGLSTYGSFVKGIWFMKFRIRKNIYSSFWMNIINVKKVFFKSQKIFSNFFCHHYSKRRKNNSIIKLLHWNSLLTFYESTFVQINLMWIISVIIIQECSCLGRHAGFGASELCEVNSRTKVYNLLYF